MKKFCLKLVMRLFLVAGFLVVFSCDNVADVKKTVQYTKAGVSKIDFKAEVTATQVVLGQPTTFDDQSTGVVSRIWTMPGAEPKESSLAVVSPYWSSTGDKTVTLKTTFEDGSVKDTTFTIKVDPAVIDATPSALETSVYQRIYFNDNSYGVKTRKWTFDTPDTNSSNSITTTESEVYASWDNLGMKSPTLTITFLDDTTLTKEFDINILDKPNLWSSLVQGFEDQNSKDSWQTWSNELGKPWDDGVLTIVGDGAEGTDRAARINYTNGGAKLWYGMLSRDSRNFNAKIQVGKKYEFSFYVKADQPGTIHYVTLINNVEDWMMPVEGDVVQQKIVLNPTDPVSVTTQWVKHTYIIGPIDFAGKSGYNGGVGLNTYPEISFSGSTPNVFYLDEFKLKEIGN